MRTTRFITYAEFSRQLEGVSKEFSRIELGKSEANRSIYGLKIGKGSTRIMAWSQMHGDEPTSTRVLLEFMRLISDQKELLSKFSFFFIPMLNPDGAENCTRTNGRGVDLNRDFLEEQACETRLLKQWIKSFEPDLCFNMHDQRSIFAVNEWDAAFSMLAPSPDSQRSYSEKRLYSAGFLSAMSRQLENPPQGWAIGRFDDTFYPAAFGDNLMRDEIANVLFEFGHIPGDYNREFSPEFFSRAWLLAMKDWNPDQETPDGYHAISLQEKRYVDLKVSFKDGCEVYGDNYFLLVGKRADDHYDWAFRAFEPEFKPIPRYEYTAESPLNPIDKSEDHTVLHFEDGTKITPENFI